MTKKQDLVAALTHVVQKVDLAKLNRLDSLMDELRSIDELLGHNAETARDQLKTKSDALLVSLPTSDRDAILELLPRVDAESLQIAGHLLDYNWPAEIIIFLRLEDLINKEDQIPQIKSGLHSQFKTLIDNHPNLHLVILSHDSADVTAVLSGQLLGIEAINSGQVSLIYESGLGLYLGGKDRRKKDYTANLKKELSLLIERMAIAAATRISDEKFRDRFYFSATEFSLGIKVHPYARGSDENLDIKAAGELIKSLAIALADLVKEEVLPIENHIKNFFLAADPSLSQVLTPASDARVWDMERVDEYLKELRFVHLGVLGSIIRPADSTDTAAAETIIQVLNRKSLVISAGDSRFAEALLQWTLNQPNGLIACSEDADDGIKDLVESKGGIEYRAQDVSELLRILDAYLGLAKIIK